MAKDINLSALGVPIAEQNDVPDIYSLPLEFNPAADKIWRQAVVSVKAKDPKTAWHDTINKFLDLCSKANIFPYKGHKTNNDKIYTHLVEARRALVKFMDRHNLYEALRPRSVTKQVSMLAQGFVIKAEARADQLMKDPDILKVNGVFDSMGLRKSAVGHPSIWEREIQAGVRFFIANEGARMSNRWTFGYEIACPYFPEIPGNYTPSNTELEAFVSNVMYKPIVRSIRPLGVMHRLL